MPKKMIKLATFPAGGDLIGAQLNLYCYSAASSAGRAEALGHCLRSHLSAASSAGRL